MTPPGGRRTSGRRLVTRRLGEHRPVAIAPGRWSPGDAGGELGGFLHDPFTVVPHPYAGERKAGSSRAPRPARRPQADAGAAGQRQAAPSAGAPPGLQAHPYSLSALPQPPYVRLTVKGAGDHSAALARLEPGTRVAIEGPYGTFTQYAQQRRRVLLIAAGIGVTAVRSLLEDLPRGARPVVILRAARREDLVLGAEIADLAQRRGGTLYELTGSRAQAAIDERSLPHIVPDLADRDVYVCGPEGFVTDVVAVAKVLGVPDEAIHHEAFAI